MLCCETAGSLFSWDHERYNFLLPLSLRRVGIGWHVWSWSGSVWRRGDACHRRVSLLRQRAPAVCSLTFITYHGLLVRAQAMSEERGNLFQSEIILTNSSHRILENQVLWHKYNLFFFSGKAWARSTSGGKRGQTVKFKPENLNTKYNMEAFEQYQCSHLYIVKFYRRVDHIEKQPANSKWVQVGSDWKCFCFKGSSVSSVRRVILDAACRAEIS